MMDALASVIDKKAYDATIEFADRIDRDYAQHGLDVRWRMIYAEAYKFADTVSSQIARDGKAACSLGCSACCFQLVMVSPFEAFMIANDMLQHDEEHHGDNRRAYLSALHLAKLPRTSEARYKKSCPLLKNAECSIYKERPMACRTHYSQDRNACETAEEFPALLLPKVLGITIKMALDYVLTTRYGVNVEPVDLAGALTVVLPNFNKPWLEWIGGQDVFALHHDDDAVGTSYTEIIKAVARDNATNKKPGH